MQKEKERFEENKKKIRTIIREITSKKKKIETHEEQIDEMITELDSLLKNNISSNCFNLGGEIGQFLPYINIGLYSFKIPHFQEKIKDLKPIESPEFSLNFLKWRIKIYHSMNGNEKNLYISPSLTLRAGETDIKYGYNFLFQLVNAKGKDHYQKDVVKHNFSPFSETIGEMYFYRLDKIEEDGFINEAGTLQINCYFQPISFEELQKEIFFFEKNYVKEREMNSTESNSSGLICENANNFGFEAVKNFKF